MNELWITLVYTHIYIFNLLKHDTKLFSWLLHFLIYLIDYFCYTNAAMKAISYLNEPKKSGWLTISMQ